MSRAIHVDPLGGLSGDMLLSALLDVGAPIAQVQSAVDSIFPHKYALSTEDVHRHNLRGALLHVDRTDGADTQGGNHTFDEMADLVRTADLPPRVKNLSDEVVQRLGEAEARVHGDNSSSMQLEQLGEDDTLIDIVGICTALHALDVDQLSVSSIPLALGKAVVDRGSVPIPGPATLALLSGFDIHGAGVGETVTPTGAAILATVGRSTTSIPSMRLFASGYGAGSRDCSGYPNVVRIFYGEQQRGAPPTMRDLTVIETNLDDLSPELVSDAAEALRRAGALDVWTTATQMKKGRVGVVLTALCETSSEEQLTTAFFESTSTFGVRSWRVSRTELERQVIVVQRPEGPVRVKVGMSAGRILSAKPEHDDVAELARKTQQPVRYLHAEVVAAVRDRIASDRIRLAPKKE